MYKIKNDESKPRGGALALRSQIQMIIIHSFLRRGITHNLRGTGTVQACGGKNGGKLIE